MSDRSKLKVANIQLNSFPSVEKNLAQILPLLNQVKDADLIVMPENSLYFQVNLDAKELLSFEITDTRFRPLQDFCDENDIALVAGGVPVLENETRYNACLWFEKNKTPEIVYRKIHLFDVEYEGASLKESLSFSPGDVPAIKTYREWKIGFSICYDLRFSELYRYYAEQEVDITLIPSSFLKYTGQVHWVTLNRARAIESQSFVVSPAQVGDHRDGEMLRQTFGHSLIIDPWGEVLSDLEGESSGASMVDLERDRIEQVKARIPIQSARRLKV